MVPRMPDSPLPLLFDLDGTLVDSLPDIAASVNFLQGHYGLPATSLETVRTFVGDGMITLLRRALAPLDRELDDAFLGAAAATYRAHYAEQCIVETRPFPGVTASLERWQAQGHPMAVVTNKPAGFAHKILEHLGLAAFLPVVIGGDTLDVRKPDPATVHAALDGLGVDHGAGWMVGDSPCDILVGKNAGLFTVAALFGYHPEADMRAAGADAYWTRFGQDLAAR